MLLYLLLSAAPFREEREEREESEEIEDINIIPQTDIRETIFFAFADRKIPILSMQTTKASLEQVFLELTAEDTLDTADGEDASDEDSVMETEKEEV